MKLAIARLCIDCEEVHEAQRCPACGSTSFAFLRQWVAPTSSAAEPPKSAEVERARTYRRLLVADAVGPKAARLLKRGAIGLAAVSLARWIWRAYRPRRPGERLERPSASSAGTQSE